ncbi:F-box protein At2g39490 [Helianthus annuus]|uniref:F-box protein At2g39490 n=1 Tax=Helianthus annuus TaxID=4232 RepID=UPI000B8F23BC|nr:F-box protein At2g39490 [Helianthus annuus]
MAENKENPISINDVPTEILYQIVSLIPLKEAARTIILSSSWKHLWTPIQVFLNINSDQITSQESGQQMSRVVSSFLNTYVNSYQILNLSFLESNSVSHEETLFMKAIKGVDKELYISFHGECTNDFSLSIELPLCENANLFSLKTLHLRSITGMARSFLPELFSGCRNLETLSLEKCNGLQYVDLKAHDMLHNFVILDCENMRSVNILSAPNLKSFLYRGTLAKIELKEVPKLCDVTLNLKGTTTLSDCNEFDCEDIVSLLASLKDVEVLTLSGWLLEWLCTRGVTLDMLEFKFDKLKELSWIDYCMNRQKRDSLAAFLTLTPSLENLFIKIDEKWSAVPSPHFHESWPYVWTDNLHSFQLKHLKMVKFFGFKIGEDDQMLASLMDLLLKRAIAIKEMSVAEPENKLSWRVAKIPQSHLKTIKSSSTRTSYSSKSSSLLLSLSDKCYFQLTPILV